MLAAAAPIALVILVLSAWSVGGWSAVRFGLVGKRGVLWLAWWQVNVFVPATIYTSVLREFDPGDPAKALLIPHWAMWALFFAVSGMGGAALALVLAGRPLRGNQVLFALVLISNAIFIPTPILLAILPEHDQGRGLLILSVYLIFLQTMMWTLGVWWISGGTGKPGWASIPWARLVNPPLVSIVAAYVCVYVEPLRLLLEPKAGFWAYVALPKYVVGPVGMILLGCLFAQEPPRWRGRRLDIAVVCLLRGLLVPGASLAALLFLRPDPVFGLVVIIVASTPPATNLSVLAAYYGGPVGRLTSTYLPSYLLTAVTLPLWTGLYLAMVGGIG